MITKFIHHISLIIIMIMCFIYNLFAQQEVLRPLKYNHQLRLYNANNIGASAKMQTTADTLPIPFVDDFSGTSVYPDSTKWMDKNVFVNTDFPINPPSIGVATFDGSNSSGNAYDNNSASSAGACDTLTSKPINLHGDAQGNLYLLSDSIWLTFFVERKGRGNSVDAGDSLILEFYDKDSLTWTQMWSEYGGTQDTVFSKIKIPVTDTKWLDDGFQFRFINYGATTGSLDHWHLDYVLLQRNFTPYDNNINDIAYRYRSPSFLINYTSVPWNHFTSYPNQSSLIKPIIYLEAYNNNTTTAYNVQFTDAIFQGSMSNQVFFHNSGSNNVNPGQDTLYADTLTGFSPPNNTNNEEVFYLLNKMSNNVTGSGLDEIRTNDSIVTKQVFRSYYSYDDGTAEAGYSITNTVNAKLAMRFDLLQADTIRAVQIFFAQQYDNSSAYPFRLAIWSSLTPENLIYQRASLTPDYMDTINGFATYTIPDSILILSGSVYIGMILNLANDYDLGFDANTNTSSHMYYNSTGSWFQTSLKGTFMIRPVFGDSTIFAGISEPKKNNSVMLYPNPSHDKVNIVSSNENEIFNIEFFDCMGRLILKQKIDNGTADISTLQKGFYTVRITSNDQQKVYIKKLVVN
ncbi:MAG: T9SS type A sorting domain-containing protein [Bacteroidia bacterium]